MEEQEIFFRRNDADTWALARLHHSLLLQIQDSPLWEREDIPDIPLTEEQMISFVRSYSPDFDCRYAPYMLGGWFYITRSGYWLKKLKYKKSDDGYYHVTEHYTTQKEKGRNLLAEILAEGYFTPRIFDDRLRELFKQLYQEYNQGEPEQRTYGFPPLLCDNPRILILGTLPGGESLEHQEYYYSNSNRIWKVLCRLTGAPMPKDYTQKKILLERCHIVLWDYYESAIRPDSSNDKDIRDGHPNDIAAFLREHPSIKTIAINGFGKYKEFGRKIEKELSAIPAFADVRVLRLPETSGSNKNYGWGDEEKLAREWSQIFD